MRNPRRLLAFIPLIMLLLVSLACDSPITGITCLYPANGAVYAPDGSQTWISHDGGFTWTSQPSSAFFGSEGCGFVASLSDPTNPQIQYRFKEAWSIERSEDGGAMWRLE